jgi:molybdopterin-guanine dinucleotide biosynthesis protein MobB
MTGLLLAGIPLMGFAAFSGTGKTTLLCKLIPLLGERGIRVALIKSSHHDFEIDTPGKDSYEMRMAGAAQVIIASPYRIAQIEERQPPAMPALDQLIARLQLEAVDLVLVEGFRDTPFAKIELHRPALSKPLLFPADDSIVAVATDVPIETGKLPRLELNQPREIADFLFNFFDFK